MLIIAVEIEEEGRLGVEISCELSEIGVLVCKESALSEN